MPVWFELMVTMLAAYMLGLGIGWLIWGSTGLKDEDANKDM